MWQTILLLTGLFSIKNLFFFSLFQHSYLILPFDIIGLAIGSQTYQWSYILEWLLLGWVGLPDELQFLNNDSFNFNPWAPTISWSIVFVLANLINLIKNKFDFYKAIETNLKFMMINYLPISLWNLHRVIDSSYDNDDFWPPFINLMFFNTMAFGLLSIIFYFTYGHHLNFYRKKFYFLISDYHPKYKWFNLFTFIFKMCMITFIFYHHYFQNSDYYILIGLTLALLIIFIILKSEGQIGAFKNKWHNINFSIALIVALFVLSIGQVENYYSLRGLFLTKIIMVSVLLFILSLNIYNQNKIKKSDLTEPLLS